MTSLFAFIVVIGIIVFVHELGHFLAAKLSGVRVETFSLGFPPKMISKKYGETEYQICWIPLGGFVKMSGMIDESMDDKDDINDPRGFAAQNIFKKIIIITAGVIMNFILGAIIFACLTFSNGVGEIQGTEISFVAKESPAEAIGLVAGDEIVEIDGKIISTWDQLLQSVKVSPELPITVKWIRNGEEMTAEAVPFASSEIDLQTGERETVGKLGIVGTLVMRKVGLIESIVTGAGQVYKIIKLNVLSVKMLFTGVAKVNELTGPLGIARLSGESAKSGIASFFSFIAFISISIGFLNIMPIPMLDGGHLVFIIIEGIIRRPIPEVLKINMMKVGFALLILLIIVVSYHDIIRIFTGK